MNSPTPCKSFVRAEPEHHLLDGRIGGHALSVRRRVDETWRRQQLETLIDADQKFGRNDDALDRAELDTFGLALGRTQLAARVNLDFDAASGIFFKRGRIAFGKLVQLVVEGGERYFHHIGLVLRGERRGARRQRDQERSDQPAHCGFSFGGKHKYL